MRIKFIDDEDEYPDCFTIFPMIKDQIKYTDSSADHDVVLDMKKYHFDRLVLVYYKSSTKQPTDLCIESFYQTMKHATYLGICNPHFYSRVADEFCVSPEKS